MKPRLKKWFSAKDFARNDITYFLRVLRRIATPGAYMALTTLHLPGQHKVYGIHPGHGQTHIANDETNSK